MKRFITIIMTISLVITSLVFFDVNIPFKASAATQQELQDKINALDEEIEEKSQKLDELAEDKSAQQEYLDTLEDQISAVEEKASDIQTQIQSIDNDISELDAQLTQLNNEIEQLQSDIDTAQRNIEKIQKSIDETSVLLAQRLRASYINGNDSTLKILMGSDSLASFMTRLEMMRRISESDKKTIDDFKAKATELKETKATLEANQEKLTEKSDEINLKKTEEVEKKQALGVKQSEYKATVSTLTSKYSEVEEYVAKLDESSATYKAYIQQLQAQKAAADAEIDAIISRYYATTSVTTKGETLEAGNANPTTSYSGGSSDGSTVYPSSASWAWPLGGASCYISSGYGNRSASVSGWSFHGGIDISGGGIYGKPVYATRAGTVISAINGTTGYGRYVMIDHGDGFISIYGHCSSLAVSSGQYVQKGALISYVGSTGNSTGPHLHFEIRYNGSKVNPLNYVSKP